MADETEIVEEYDVLVHVDFDSRIEDDCFHNLKQFKLIGIETQEPVLQLGDQVFKGVWTDTVGTDVFLEEKATQDQDLDVFSESRRETLEYVCKTDKLLRMDRVFISLKDQEQRNNTDTDTEPQATGDTEVTAPHESADNNDAAAEPSRGPIVKQEPVDEQQDHSIDIVKQEVLPGNME